LVWGQEQSFDAIRIAANADRDARVPRFSVDAKAHVAQVFANDPAPTGEAAGECAEERRLDPTRAGSESHQRTSDFRVSTTDPDAASMRTGTRTDLGYHDHDGVDGWKQRIILAALVTPADAMENVPLQDLLWRVRFRWKLRPRRVTGDTTYGTGETIVALEDAGIQAFFPLPEFDARTPFFGERPFVYDGSVDASRCPGGELWPFRKHKYTEWVRVYQEPAAICNA
jgi:hypothetical protein